MSKFYGYVLAQDGRWLNGGVRFATSTGFDTPEEAREWVEAMKDLQPWKSTAVISLDSHVELSPACDLWMRGARFGTIRRVRDGFVWLRMDNRRVRKLVMVPITHIQIHKEER